MKKSLGTLGDAAIEYLISDLEHYGIELSSPSAKYTLLQIEIAFIRMFGDDATSLLMAKIKHALGDDGIQGQ